MKSYTPENLVAISRYRRFFPTLPAEIQQDVYRRIRTLLLEEQQYCDKGNYKHIAQILGTQQYARLRFGIGNDFYHGQQVDYVLGQFPPEEEALIPERTKETSAAIKTFCLAGIQMAMNQLNKKKNGASPS